MSSVKLGSALPYAPRCFTTEPQGLYMVSEAHYEVHVSLSHARDKTKNLERGPLRSSCVFVPRS